MRVVRIELKSNYKPSKIFVFGTSFSEMLLQLLFFFTIYEARYQALQHVGTSFLRESRKENSNPVTKTQKNRIDRDRLQNLCDQLGQRLPSLSTSFQSQ